MRETCSEEAPGLVRIELDITPIPKPRMTKKTTWKPAAKRYFAWKDHLLLLMQPYLNKYCFDYRVMGFEFYLPLPKKQAKSDTRKPGDPHEQQTPDLDNLIKAVKDALLENDFCVWKYDPSPFKVWAKEGKLVLILCKKT